MSKLPWGHQSRTCVACGCVGPRIQVQGGWSHLYCLSPEERRARRQVARKLNTANWGVAIPTVEARDAEGKHGLVSARHAPVEVRGAKGGGA